MTTDVGASSETPAQYVSRVKEQCPRRDIDTTSIPPALTELHGSEDAARMALEALRGRDYAQDLLARLKPGLPEVVNELIQEGVIAVGDVGDPIPNARAERLDGSGYAILFHDGLQRFLYRVTRVLSTRFQPTGTDDSAESVSFEESCRILSDVFFWYRETGRAAGPDYPVTTFQLTIASTLATEAESFFLAHELGHVFNDLRAYATEATPAERDAAWGNEFDADRFALTVLINSRNQEGSVVPVEFCYAGAEIALSTFGGLEALGVDFGTSHPPAQERLNAIRQHIRESCTTDSSHERITTLSRPLDLVFQRIISQLSAPDWESFLDRAAADVVAELDRLLIQCTGGFVPDYVTFKMTMPQLFDKLSSHRLYERVASAAADFTRHMKLMHENAEDSAKQEAWVAFQKYKLFMSMIRDMNEPFKTLLEEALGIPT